MITEDYVSFETAKLLKEKGFNEDIDLWYDENGEMFSCHKYDISGDWRVKVQQEVYLCPTLQMAMKWLKEAHKLHIVAPLTYDSPRLYEAKIMRTDVCKDVVLCPEKDFNSPEEACEVAIKYCLENLI